jgi:hypothetical protein
MGSARRYRETAQSQRPSETCHRYPFSGDGDAVKISRLLLRCFRLLPAAAPMQFPPRLDGELFIL